MAYEDACGWCGEWFVKHGNQKYCCKECSKLAEKQQIYLSQKKRNIQKRKVQTAPSLSIHDMVDLMLKLEKELGRVVQYGGVQEMLLTGKLKVKDGVIKWK
jgi:hypothetical protein